MLRCQTKTAS